MSNRPGLTVFPRPVLEEELVDSLDDLHRAILTVLAERGEIEIVNSHGSDRNVSCSA
jgi:hypothetical protein